MILAHYKAVKAFKDLGCTGKIGAERVMLCGPINDIFDRESLAHADLNALVQDTKLLKDHGYEVVFWVGGFGHGEPLSGEQKKAVRYTLITGSDGVTTNAICPLDEAFRSDYAAGIKELAKAQLDGILLDDDFRISARAYNLGCCCDLHMERYREALGEDLRREDMERLVLTGGPNRYCKAFL